MFTKREFELIRDVVNHLNFCSEATKTLIKEMQSCKANGEQIESAINYLAFNLDNAGNCLNKLMASELKANGYKKGKDNLWVKK
jgi:hypothetical protein